jgi:hypothetical protein
LPGEVDHLKALTAELIVPEAVPAPGSRPVMMWTIDFEINAKGGKLEVQNETRSRGRLRDIRNV